MDTEPSTKLRRDREKEVGINVVSGIEQITISFYPP
jgi:hypothetical protein